MSVTRPGQGEPVPMDLSPLASAGADVGTDDAATLPPDVPLEIEPSYLDERQIRATIAVGEELPRVRRYLFIIMLLAVFVAVYFSRDVLLPIVLAILITLTLGPLVRKLGRIGVPSAISAVAVVVILAIVITVSGYLLSGPVGDLIDRAPIIAAQMEWRFRVMLAESPMARDMADLVGNMPTEGEEADDGPFPRLGTLLTSMAGSAANTVTTIGVALVLTMFLLSSDEMFHRRIVETAPRLTDKKRALLIVRDVERQISRYLAAITLINAGLGVAVGIALWAIGMPYPYLWAIAAFLLNYLPFLGGVIGTVTATAVALATFDSVYYALLAPLAYLTLTSIEGQFVTPLVVGRRLELNTTSVFVTVVFWIWLWGVPGALLAVPFLVVVKVVCDNIDGLKPMGRFLSGADHDPSHPTEQGAHKPGS